MGINTNGIPSEAERESGISAGIGVWKNPKSKVSRAAQVAASQLADPDCEECSGDGTIKAWCGNDENPEIWRCGCLRFTSNAQQRRFDSSFKFDNTSHS